MERSWNRESLLELSRAYQRSQPLLAAVELGLFAILGDRPRTARDVAAAVDTDPRGTELLLNGLSALGILDKKEAGFTLRAELRPLLAPEGGSSVLAMLAHQVTCAHRWDRLADAVRSGESPARRQVAWDEVRYRAFIEAMHVLGREMADGIVARLEPRRFRRALDVGGASGTYTIALLRAAPELRATLFDLPPVIAMARDRLADADLLERVDLVAGDFYVDALPEGHDLALLSAIIHQNSRAQNRALYARCLAALGPGGTLVIRDILMDETHTRPPAGALFALNMLVSTEAGGTYSFAEIREDLEAAGFADVHLLQQGSWMDGLVTARRPG